jgi:hypothetical protein
MQKRQEWHSVWFQGTRKIWKNLRAERLAKSHSFCVELSPSRTFNQHGMMEENFLLRRLTKRVILKLGCGF